MKKISAAILCIAIITATNQGYSQIHLGAQLSALKNTKENFGITGFGTHVRLFLGKNLALGGNFRLWPKRTEEEKQGTLTAKHSNSLGNISAMLEYYFTERDTRPYIGMDGGFYFTQNKMLVKEGDAVLASTSSRKSYFGLGPKIGLGLDLTNVVGFFAQIQYNLLFGSADETVSNGFKSRPIDKFWSFDLGAYLRLKPGTER